MLRSATANRRTILRLMGSGLASLCLSLMAPPEAVANALSRLPGSLSLLPLREEVLRQARRHMQFQPVDRSIYQAARSYLHDPDHLSAVGRFERRVRKDFVAGRVAVVDGWVISETELAFLALLKRAA